MQKEQLLFVVGTNPVLYTDPKEAWSELGDNEALRTYVYLDGEIDDIDYLSSYDANNYEDFYNKVVLPRKIKALERTIAVAEQELEAVKRELK